jgi:hypothetical protein
VHRWERLFADLEAQADSAERLELDAEVAERTRTERGRIRMSDRLRAADGPVTVRAGSDVIHGRVLDVGADWVLVEVDDPAATEVLVALGAIQAIDGLTTRAQEPGSAGQVAERLDLRHVLRSLSRSRDPVLIATADGSRLRARLDRVGADHIDATALDLGDGSTSRLVPLSAISTVRRA